MKTKIIMKTSVTALVTITACLLLFGCSNKQQRGSHETQAHQVTQPLHFYVEQLTRQLLLTSPSIKLDQRVAVGTILPLSGLSGNNEPQENLIGQQLQESLVTLATQAGLNVIEFKTMRSIKIKENQDIMLSRHLKEINTELNANYFLTGTYHRERQNLVVNIRLIDITTNNIVAAATDTIPVNITWSQRVSQARPAERAHNSLYRGLN